MPLRGHPAVADVAFSVFLEEDEGPDHDVLATRGLVAAVRSLSLL
jgi:hypothetical protein